MPEIDLESLSNEELLALEQQELRKLKTPQKIGGAEAIGRGVEEGVSLGLAKHGRGLAGAVFETLNPEAEDKAPASERFTRSLIKETAGEEQKIRDIEKQQPIPFGVARGIGTIVPALPAVVSGVAPGIATGTVIGGIEGLSSEKGDFDKGAAKGLLAGIATAGLGAALKPIGKALQSVSQKSVIKAMRFAPTTLRRLATRGNVLGKAGEIADDMVNLKIANNPIGLTKLYDKTAGTLKNTGEVLGDLYKSADEALPGGVLSVNEVKDVIGAHLAKTRRFADPESIAKATNEIVSGLEQVVPKQTATDAISGIAKKKVSANDLWDFVKNMDDLSRQYERASDPAFATKADDLVEAATALRRVLGERIEGAAPQIAKDITNLSGIYRNLSTAEGALKDRIIREMSSNKSIPRQTMVDLITDLLPTTHGRLGAAKAARGAAKGLPAALPAGLAGMIEAGRQ